MARPQTGARLIRRHELAAMTPAAWIHREIAEGRLAPAPDPEALALAAATLRARAPSRRRRRKAETR